MHFISLDFFWFFDWSKKYFQNKKYEFKANWNFQFLNSIVCECHSFDLFSSSHLNVLQNPRHEWADTCVDARILTLSTANAPRNDANLKPMSFVVDHQWATRIAAARITWCLTSANHRVWDSAWRSVAVLCATCRISPNRNIHLLQNRWLWSIWNETSIAMRNRHENGFLLEGEDSYFHVNFPSQ